MSAVKEAINAIRDAMLLADKVQKVGETLERMSNVVEGHEKRLIRLEAKWETAIEIAAINRSSRKIEG